MKTIGDYNEKKIHFTPVGSPVEMKQGLSPDIHKQCEELGRAMAKALLEEK